MAGRSPSSVPIGDLFSSPGAPAAPRDTPCSRIEPALDGLLANAGEVPPRLHFGTSSWSFPGWRGLVYAGKHSAAALSRHGLAAYALIPMLRSVGIDRTFYAPIETAMYAGYASQVPDDFRFLVKAPGSVTDAVRRNADGRGQERNPRFLDPGVACETFVGPCLDGLGEKAGPLLFQLPPITRDLYGSPSLFAERIAGFFSALPRQVMGIAPLYALELRNPELLTPRLMQALAAQGVRYCIGLHARMPPALRQARALAALDGADAYGNWRPCGPLVVRWNLRPGLAYEAARRRYAPFDRLVDEDPQCRGVVAGLVAKALDGGQPVWVIANNKAEGSAPLTLLQLCRAVRDLRSRPADHANMPPSRIEPLTELPESATTD
jgi:uncharacterized protein YecE (DUF72 family)